MLKRAPTSLIGRLFPIVHCQRTSKYPWAWREFREQNFTASRYQINRRRVELGNFIRAGEVLLSRKRGGLDFDWRTRSTSEAHIKISQALGNRLDVRTVLIGCVLQRFASKMARRT